MKSYVLPIVLEPDQDTWRAFVPGLEARGVAAWGWTKEEAYRNIREVAEMVTAELLEAGEPLPGNVIVSDTLAVSVMVECAQK